MSIKLGLLTLLAEQPMYGAKLRSEFEARTGGTWPLNVGQVYTTLNRLERDGLVEPLEPPHGLDDEGRIAYTLTAAGRGAASSWWHTPVDRQETPRDELVMKLALAVTAPGVNVVEVVQTQRTAAMRHLRDLTRLKATSEESPESHDLSWSLVLEHHLFAVEAETRWLDHVEARLSVEAARPSGASPAMGGPRRAERSDSASVASVAR